MPRVDSQESRFRASALREKQKRSRVSYQPLSRDTAQAMSQDNVATVKDAYRAFADEGLNRFLEHWTEDLDHRSIEGDPVYPDPIRGRQAMGAFVQDWIDTFDEFRIEPVELIDAGGGVVAGVLRYGGRARLSGIESYDTIGVMFTIRDGKIACGREYRTRAQALEAAGLLE